MSKLVQLKDDNGVNLYPVTEGTVIYENASGNKGNITLDDYIYNYKYIKIYGKNADTTAVRTQLYLAQEFFTNFQDQIEVQISWTGNGNGIIYPNGTYYYINGKSMTIEWSYRIGLYGTNQGYAGTDNRYAILKIIGYK